MILAKSSLILKYYIQPMTKAFYSYFLNMLFILSMFLCFFLVNQLIFYLLNTQSFLSLAHLLQHTHCATTYAHLIRSLILISCVYFHSLHDDRIAYLCTKILIFIYGYMITIVRQSFRVGLIFKLVFCLCDYSWAHLLKKQKKQTKKHTS